MGIRFEHMDIHTVVDLCFLFKPRKPSPNCVRLNPPQPSLCLHNMNMHDLPCASAFNEQSRRKSFTETNNVNKMHTWARQAAITHNPPLQWNHLANPLHSKISMSPIPGPLSGTHTHRFTWIGLLCSRKRFILEKQTGMLSRPGLELSGISKSFPQFTAVF